MVYDSEGSVSIEVMFQSGNLYNYCSSDPVNRIDATGYFFKAIGNWFKNTFGVENKVYSNIDVNGNNAFDIYLILISVKQGTSVKTDFTAKSNKPIVFFTDTNKGGIGLSLKLGNFKVSSTLSKSGLQSTISYTDVDANKIYSFMTTMLGLRTSLTFSIGEISGDVTTTSSFTFTVNNAEIAAIFAAPSFLPYLIAFFNSGSVHNFY